jgi:hypothetical protein
MKLKLLTVAAGVALLATAITAKAQKAYKEGVITYSVNSPRGAADTKLYFKADSNVTVTASGPATIKILSIGKGDYLAVLVDVPVMSKKVAAIATPAELEEGQAALPELTFTPGTETKVIAGLNCKKVTAKNPKDNSTFDVWVTNDISTPSNSLTALYGKVGGFPVMFTTYQQGATVSVTFKSISDEKVPANSFKVPADFEKIGLGDLAKLFGGR